MTTTEATLAAQIDALHHQSAGRLPADVLAAFSEEQQQLDAAGIPTGVAPVGSVMPDGDLQDVHGDSTTLTAARDGRPAVVVFYRGAWCPYCNIALRAYQEQLQPALDARGVALVAISPQTPDGSLTMQQTKELTFAVLSDPGNQIARELGILTAPTEPVRQAQATLGLDLTAVNADHTTALPMPTVAVVDATGIVRWIDVHPNYATRTEPVAILTALAALG